MTKVYGQMYVQIEITMFHSILENVKNFVKSHLYEILSTTLKRLRPYYALSELCVVLALPTDCRALLASLKPISTPKKKKPVPFLLTLH